MKVVLLKDIPKIGKKFDVKELAPGYANYLMKLNQVTSATKEAVQKAKTKVESEAETKKLKNELLLKNLKSLIGKKLSIKAKANEEGSLYAKIHKDEILKAIKDEYQIEINESAFDLPKPIDSLGEHIIDIKTVNGSFLVSVEKSD